MDAERWQKIETIYHAALARPAEVRNAYLVEVCAGDTELCAEVQILIAQHEESGSFIDTPVFDLGVRALAEQTPLSAGKTVGHYIILDIIGRGGMGEVYLARDPRLGRKVALKLLPVELKSDRDRVQRFRQEARAASAVSHPNIAHVYDVGEADGRFYTAIEYVDGITLRQLILAEKIDTHRAVDIAIQVAEALAAAHASGVVHRDIKPENVMVRHDGYIKVLDFGLAKLTEQQKPTVSGEADTVRMVQTQAGVVMGTATYMSPEQARGQEVDARTDIWSLGVVLYEMVAGTAPFVGESMSDVIAAILKSEPSQLSELTPELPHEMQRIVRKALRKDREERYQTIKDMALDLKNLRRELEINAELGSESLGLNEEEIGQPSESARGSTKGVLTDPSHEDKARPTSSAEYLINGIRQHRTQLALSSSIILITLVGLSYGLYRLMRIVVPQSALQSMQITKLVADGKTIEAAISPDGNYLAYILEKGKERSLWIKHLASDSTLQIVPPTKSPVTGGAFSKDGGYFYYTESDSSLFRVPVLGGTSVKIMDHVDTDFSFSPDGKQVTFKRSSREFNSYDVIVANLDGTGERKLTTRKPPLGFLAQSGPAWSPDGKTIVYAAEVPPRKVKLFAFSVADSAEIELGSQVWSNVWRINWVSDGTTLIIAGQIESSLTSQMWQLSYPTAELKKLTNDVNHYIDASLSADSKKLVAIHQDWVSQIWTKSANDNGNFQQLTFGNEREVAWTPDDRIVYISHVSDGTQLWIMAKDGTNQKKLTSGPGIYEHPSISPDGRHIAYASETHGRRNIWRMDIDGNTQIQLTDGDSDDWPTFSADSQWIIYNSNAWTCWKISTNGGKPSKIKDNSMVPRVSPDGKLIASAYSDSTGQGMQITSLDKGEAIKLFERPLTPLYFIVRCQWLSDGRGIIYEEVRGTVSNLWVQPIDGSSPKQITDFKSGAISSFDWSRDGKQLAIVRATQNTEADLITNFR